METLSVVPLLLTLALLVTLPASAQFVDMGNISTGGGEVVLRADHANKVEFGTTTGGQPYVRLTFPPPRGAVISSDSKAIAKIQQIITGSSVAWFPVDAGGGTAFVRLASVLRAVFPPCGSSPCTATVEPYQGLIETVKPGDVANLKTVTSDATNWLALADKRTYLHLNDVRGVTFSCANAACSKATVDFSITTPAVLSDASEISQLEQIVGYTPTLAVKKQKTSQVLARSSGVRKHSSKHE
jgi:hypothetical protein